MDRYFEFVTNHWMLFIALCVVTFLLIQDLIETALQKFETISPILAVAKMNTEGTVVLDVREEMDYAKGHIESAINTPLAKLDKGNNNLDEYKNSPVVVVCQTGTRSTPACKTLTKQGFEKVFQIKGGMQSWEENKLPIRVGSKGKPA